MSRSAAKREPLTAISFGQLARQSGHLNLPPVDAACTPRAKQKPRPATAPASGGHHGAGVQAELERSRINVFVRVRPLLGGEHAAGDRCLTVQDGRSVTIAEAAHPGDYLKNKRLLSRRFTFDGAFGETISSATVYDRAVEPLVTAVLAEGANATCFCYGATGSGKTYTMTGSPAQPGIAVLAIRDLFARVASGGGGRVQLNYVEIYNEACRDLLAGGAPLALREDPGGVGVVLHGVSSHAAGSATEVLALLQKGNTRRVTEPTRVNETSSRSHAVLVVRVDRPGRRPVQLSLVDLAGSERSTATDVRTARSLEGTSINKSLLALSGCISALVARKRHVPYRDSKLTLLLKDSLGGSCLTAMVACVCPHAAGLGETQTTLHWADRAKAIRVTAPPEDGEPAVMVAPPEVTPVPPPSVPRPPRMGSLRAGAVRTGGGGVGGACPTSAAALADRVAALEIENGALKRQLASARAQLAAATAAAGGDDNTTGPARQRRRLNTGAAEPSPHNRAAALEAIAGLRTHRLTERRGGDA